jgi:hypothetical protein
LPVPDQAADVELVVQDPGAALPIAGDGAEAPMSVSGCGDRRSGHGDAVKRMRESGGSIGKIFGQESIITTYNLARMNMLLHGVKDTEFEIFHGDTLENE